MCLYVTFQDLLCVCLKPLADVLKRQIFKSVYNCANVFSRVDSFKSLYAVKTYDYYIKR